MPLVRAVSNGRGFFALTTAVAAIMLAAPGVASAPSWSSASVGDCYLPSFRTVTAELSGSDDFQTDCKATSFTYNTETISMFRTSELAFGKYNAFHTLCRHTID